MDHVGIGFGQSKVKDVASIVSRCCHILRQAASVSSIALNCSLSEESLLIYILKSPTMRSCPLISASAINSDKSDTKVVNVSLLNLQKMGEVDIYKKCGTVRILTPLWLSYAQKICILVTWHSLHYKNLCE